MPEHNRTPLSSVDDDFMPMPWDALDVVDLDAAVAGADHPDLWTHAVPIALADRGCHVSRPGRAARGLERDGAAEGHATSIRNCSGFVDQDGTWRPDSRRAW
jgi:hypothetical protein